MGYINRTVNTTDLPIEFKEINPEDFPDYDVKGNSKYIISSDENGFISEKLIEVIDINESNTVIINAGVGEGKSTACIDLAKAYYEKFNSNNEREYVVIIIAPYYSIINQYHKKLIKKGVNERDTFNFSEIDDIDLDLTIKSPIHILTIHSLIGYYGERGFMQKRQTRDYLTATIEYCTQKDKKIVFLLDEVHDYVGLIKQKFIFNLWKWQPVLHKTFIMTATYTEGTKVAIKYLAELTDDKIQIIESIRKRVIDRQCKLHLFIHDKSSYNADDDKIAELIKNEIQRGQKIHILSFSETLASNIAEGVTNSKGETQYAKIGKLLIDKFGEINLCVGGNRNPFKESMCNVGTTFKTGISIEEDNTSFFIIAPHKMAYLTKGGNENFGIFYNGMVSVIQAIARVRGIPSSDIFVIMPRPQRLIVNASNSIAARTYLDEIEKTASLKYLKPSGKYIDHISLKEQGRLLESYYKQSYDFAYEGIKNFNNKFRNPDERSVAKPTLKFPSKEEIILEDGDRFLASIHESYGSDISAYIIWAAFNNQFQNCTLDKVYYEDTIVLEQGEITNGLFNILYNKKGFPTNIDYLADKEFYDKFYQYLTAEIDLYIRRHNGKLEKAKDSPKLKEQLINIVQYFKKHNPEFFAALYPHGRIDKKGIAYKPKDVFFPKTTYLKAAIAHASHYLADYQTQLTGKEKESLKWYRLLFASLKKLKQIILFQNSQGVYYIPKKDIIIRKRLVPVILSLDLFKSVKGIRDNDFFIEDDSISFCQWAKSITVKEVQRSSIFQKKALLRMLDEFIDILFEVKDSSISMQTFLSNSSGITFGGIRKVDKVISETNFSSFLAIVNLIYTSNCPDLESIVSENFIQEQIKHYNESKHKPDAIF